MPDGLALLSERVQPLDGVLGEHQLVEGGAVVADGVDNVDTERFPFIYGECILTEIVQQYAANGRVGGWPR